MVLIGSNGAAFGVVAVAASFDHYGLVTSDANGSLSKADSAVIAGCLNAAVHGPFFPEWEFHTLFGLTRAEVDTVLTNWPDLPDTAPHGYESPLDFQEQAINNTMNNLLGYPHGVQGDAFAHEVGATMQQVASTMTRWRSDDAFDPTGKGYFDRLT